MSNQKTYFFKKIINGVEYTCKKSYVTKYEKAGRPKKTEEQKLTDKINRLKKKQELLNQNHENIIF